MSEMRAGYGEKVITPPLGVDLTGYGYYRDRKAEAVMDDLKARVLFIRQGKESIILISCDLLGMAVDYADAVRAEISLRQRVPMQNILLACTHTHSGPAVQPLPGLGEPDAAYSCQLPAIIQEAVGLAKRDSAQAEMCCHAEIVEPIGFNRRSRSFDPIDPALRIVLFKRCNHNIYLLNYACHPVMLGPTKSISGDWPGALMAAVEHDGHRGIYFQGFCGDIDPVSNFNRWGGAGKEDVDFYGRLLWDRALKAEKFAVMQPSAGIRAVERRLNLRLDVPAKAEIAGEKKAWLEKCGSVASPSGRFIEEWAIRADKYYDEVNREPYLANVPVQAISIGPLKMLCLPGEVFCRYGLRLQEQQSLLCTIGYANGNIGYLPTADAYAHADDYACYGAPKFYGLFPFARDTESILLEESRKILM